MEVDVMKVGKESVSGRVWVCCFTRGSGKASRKREHVSPDLKKVCQSGQALLC